MYIDFMSVVHRSQKRDYLARVNDREFPKARAAELAKKFDFDYWDGDRRINYGGYKYMPGRWTPIARKIIQHYDLKDGARILDVGCGKGFLIYEFTQLLDRVEVFGIDKSEYAIRHAKPEIADKIVHGCASSLPFDEDMFDLVLSINTLHCLQNYQLDSALREIERVSKKHKYVCVESFRNETEKANLLYWQVTCEMFSSPEAWEWWFNHTGYSGDHSYIFFE